MLETITVGVVVAGAVYYLYRQFRRTASVAGMSCSCGCDGCRAAQIGIKSENFLGKPNKKFSPDISCHELPGK